ncbi:cysteine--tRNA ligase [candidate division KSB1 bacterium]|nr:cysteine--tRNA ligase [candidate division KSB1 bacterium]
MALRIYNTYTNSVEAFKPLADSKVKMYVCGPTVYNYFHIGNARPLLMFDIFRRYLMYRGYDVRYVVNITDIDDKIIRSANEEKTSTAEVAAKYTQAYFEDCEKLGIRNPDVSPKATDHIDDMIELVKKLVDQGIAYPAEGDVFYDVKKLPQYGKLSGKKIDDLKSGARVEVDKRKKDPLDFVLWKAAKPGEPSWESPWGKGRPGWHLECSVMSMKYLGNTFDIHAGGVDLIFPHHENEIAQSEGATGTRFVNYWMHNGFLNVDGEKMAKSAGNFFTAREILEKYKPEVIRMFFLLKHYRSPIDFSEERIHESQQALSRINSTLANIDIALKEFQPDAKKINGSTIINNLREQFLAALDDDFNTANAMAKIFEMVREANIIMSAEQIQQRDLEALLRIKNTILEFNEFLGIIESEQNKISEVEQKVYLDILVEVRQKLREQKNWKLADFIRDRLVEKGIELEDRKDKTVWKKF